MLLIGENVKYTKEKGLLGSVEEALSYNSTTFMFYTGAPQNTLRSPINKDLYDKAMNLIDRSDIDYSKVIVHAPYIINLANPDEKKLDFSIDFLISEIKRCCELNIKYLVLHPGSHVGLGVDNGIRTIIDALNKVIDNSNDVKILLETMAGKGSEVGSNFNEIKKIINGIKNKNRIGVCMDTCHMHDAGYDMTDFDTLLDYFDEVVGLDYLYCIHINDSKNEKDSHKDRHENIGFGYIGFDNLINVIYNERLKDIPKILETPYIDDKAPYKYEIEMIKNKKFDKNLKEKVS